MIDNEDTRERTVAANGSGRAESIDDLFTEAQDAIYCLLVDYMARSGCTFLTAVGIVEDGLSSAIRAYNEQRK